jgi:hypothetical protein
MLTNKGTLEPLLQSEKFSFDPTTGFRKVSVYKGASQYLMANLADNANSYLLPTELTNNQGGTATLEVTDPRNSYTIDTWQIVGNAVSMDMLSHPSLINILYSFLQNMSDLDNTISHLRINLQDSVPVDTAFSTDDILMTLADTVIGGTLKRWYALIQRGSSNYMKGQYVLRHTTNAPQAFEGNASDVGVEQIYPTSLLLSEVTDANLWVYTLPGRLFAKILSITANPPVVPDGDIYYFGWLKQPSTESTAAHFRIDITTEYTLELWSTDAYNVYGS